MADEPKPPVIIKAFPPPEEYRDAESEFLRALGLCVSQWAFVDRQLFCLFRLGLQAATHRAALIYYTPKTLWIKVSRVTSGRQKNWRASFHASATGRWPDIRRGESWRRAVIGGADAANAHHPKCVSRHAEIRGRDTENKGFTGGLIHIPRTKRKRPDKRGAPKLYPVRSSGSELGCLDL